MSMPATKPEGELSMLIVNRLEAPDSEAELREAWQPGRTPDRREGDKK